MAALTMTDRIMAGPTGVKAWELQRNFCILPNSGEWLP